MALRWPVYGAGQSAGDYPANCSGTYPAEPTNDDLGKWVCEHRNTAIANMVKFRLVTNGQPVTNWQNIGGASSNHIAFGRGDKGFVAINRTGSQATTTYQTGMAAGSYCDITKYDYIPGTGQCIDPVTTCARRPTPGSSSTAAARSSTRRWTRWARSRSTPAAAHWR